MKVTETNSRILETLTKYWGYDRFRQFQEEAILSILDDHDTLTVLPTGGGKSVCFQLPALLSEGMAVIISPLISLMKDQVDDLKEMDVAAECLNSSLDGAEQYDVVRRIRSSELKLLYLSPERLMIDQTTELLKSVKISFFVIDEAHCISHWGHNFRDEYRQLGVLKKEFKNVGVHAFTATATAEVQQDIIKQLNLEDPHLYIGNIDRPNLNYRVLPRSGNLLGQVVDVIRKHPNEPGIIYCLRRADVDEISQHLNGMGYRNLPYHAGLPDEVRKRNQEEFSSERVHIIVATIAFGMGVDCSNIRYVIHAAMPKSIEHYQQETGRAGRDGLPADCTLFYSGADYRTWEYMLRDADNKDVLLGKLGAMYNFCVRPECRHRCLVNYFKQNYAQPNCGACDFCLGEVEMVADPLTIGQKVISCVARVNERFGADHVADVLKGNLTEAVTRWGHDKLSTFALMSAETKVFIRFLRREGEYMTLAITDSGRALLKGGAAALPALAKPIVAVKKKEIEVKARAKRDQEWEGADPALFDALRAKRAELAAEKGVPAYIIFSDKSLKDMSLTRPKNMDAFAGVFGVGASKQKQYGEVFIRVILDHSGGSAASSGAASAPSAPASPALA